MRNVNRPLINLKGLKITSIYSEQEFIQFGFDFEWLLTIRSPFTCSGLSGACGLANGLRLSSFTDDEHNFILEFSNGALLAVLTESGSNFGKLERIELIGPENAVFVWVK